MKCEEVQNLQGPYLDSELDTRTTLEIGQHLKSCPECARRFAEGEELEARIKAGLNRGQRTAELWIQIERSVAASVPVTNRPSLTPPAPRQGMLSALSAQVQGGWRRSRWAWSGLAAVWAVILGLHFTAREPGTPPVTAQRVPSASEMRLAWIQKQLLMADLAGVPKQVPADKPKAVPPSPRGERPRAMLNT
jgi:anti-sigma factor RsiW